MFDQRFDSHALLGQCLLPGRRQDLIRKRLEPGCRRHRGSAEIVASIAKHQVWKLVGTKDDSLTTREFEGR